MAQFNLVAYQELGGEGARYSFAVDDCDKLAGALAAYFTGRGYKLEEGTLAAGAYGRGNTALRFLLGAFAPRYKFNFKIWSANGQAALELSKGMCGAMGGAWGYRQMKKETEKIREDLKLL